MVKQSCALGLCERIRGLVPSLRRGGVHVRSVYEPITLIWVYHCDHGCQLACLQISAQTEHASALRPPCTRAAA